MNDALWDEDLSGWRMTLASRNWRNCKEEQMVWSSGEEQVHSSDSWPLASSFVKMFLNMLLMMVLIQVHLNKSYVQHGAMEENLVKLFFSGQESILLQRFPE